MNTALFIAKRIVKGKHSNNRFSQPIIRIAIAGVALGITVMILTVAIVTGFQQEIRNKVIGFSGNIQITNYDSNQSYEPTPIDKDQGFYNEFKNKKGIRHIQTFATKNGIIKTKNEIEGVLLKGVATDYDWSFIKKNIVDGAVFSVSDTGSSKNIVVSKIIAARLGLKTGDRLLIYFITTKKNADSTAAAVYEQRVKEFFITGIYDTGFEEYDKKIVFVDLAQIQKLNYWDKSQVGGFEVFLNKYDETDKWGEKLYEEIGMGLTAQTVRELNSTVFSWIDLQDVNAVIVIVLMILVAGINMISTLLIIILERTTMIGLFKALGAANKQIQKIFLYNALYILGQGLLWGNIAGIALCLIQQQFGIFTLPKETYYVSVIPINLEMTHVLLLNTATFFICVLMLILPSFIVSRITPVKALRFS